MALLPPLVHLVLPGWECLPSEVKSVSPAGAWLPSAPSSPFVHWERVQVAQVGGGRHICRHSLLTVFLHLGVGGSGIPDILEGRDVAASCTLKEDPASELSLSSLHPQWPCQYLFLITCLFHPSPPLASYPPMCCLQLVSAPGEGHQQGTESARDS